jgi:hypothetical protein
MDPTRFDRLARTLAAAGTRRGLVRILAALPLGVTLGALRGEGPEASAEDDDHGSSGRRHRRKAKHRHQTGNNKEHRKGKRKGQGKRPGCTSESRAKTCAGKCATVINNCGKPVACDPCTCATGCPQCQRCNPDTGLCDPVADDTICDDGDACTQTDSCQGGVCVGTNPIVCTALDQCHKVGTCNPGTGVCVGGNPKADGTVCPDGFCCGGECKECCTDQHCPSGFCHGHKVCAPKECTQSSCGVVGGVICGRHAPTGDPCLCYQRADTSGFFCAESRPDDCDAGTCPDGQTCVAGGGSQCDPAPLCALPCAWPT